MPGLLRQADQNQQHRLGQRFGLNRVRSLYNMSHIDILAGIGRLVKPIRGTLKIQMKTRIRSTTILCVRRDGKVVMSGDGQVTLGSEVLKGSAKKLRRLYNGKILAGFAGSTADAFALFTRFEAKLEQFNGNLSRSVVELAKEWRTDRMLRHLEALLVVADLNNIFIVSGNGDVIDPDDNIAAIGSGGAYAKAAATALMENTKLSALEIVEKAMAIAGKICIYTNENFVIEELG